MHGEDVVLRLARRQRLHVRLSVSQEIMPLAVLGDGQSAVGANQLGNARLALG